MNTAAKGRRNEQKTMDMLISLGYQVTSARASKGVFDVWACSSSEILLIQVKSNEWPGSVEMEQIQMFTAPPNARKLVHRWRDRANLPDVREV